MLAHKLEYPSCIMARLPSWPPYTPASFTAYANIPVLWYGICINRRVNLYGLNMIKLCNPYMGYADFIIPAGLLPHTQPFLDTDPRPPACHMIMPLQTFTAFISNVTRHPSWPRLISHISARLSSYATFVVKN